MQPVTPPPPTSTKSTALKADTANRMEAAFLEQMMKYMGPKALEGPGSGGTGEEQFQSLLTQEYARIVADRIDLRLSRGASQ